MRLIQLYLPMYPYAPISVRPNWLRRLGLRSSPFATMGEVTHAYMTRPVKTRHVRRGT